MLQFEDATIKTLRANILGFVLADIKPNTLIQRGNEWRGPCPFCGGKRDRFAVFLETKLFNCRQCNKKGDAIQYTMLRHNLSFVDAVKRMGGAVDQLPQTLDVTIAESNPMTPEERENWQCELETVIPKSIYWLLDGDGDAAAARAWLDARGIGRDEIGQFGLGYNDHWRKIIPGHNLPPGLIIPRIRYGAYEAVNCYVDKANRENYGNRRFLKGSNCHTWLNDLAITLARVVLIVEGELDAILLSRLFSPLAPSLAVTTLGGATIKPDFLALAMLEGRRVYIAFDNDAPGITGEQRLQELIPGAEIAPKMPVGKDATDFYKAGGNLSNWLDTFLECPIM